MKGRIVIVTDATSGIGKEIARGLPKKGATVILGVCNKEKARGVRNEIAKAPERPKYHHRQHADGGTFAR